MWELIPLWLSSKFSLSISPKDIAITDKNPGEFGVRLSLEGKFVHVEGKTAASLGYSSLELLGKSYFELVHVDDLEKIEDSFGKRKSPLWLRLSQVRGI